MKLRSLVVLGLTLILSLLAFSSIMPLKTFAQDYDDYYFDDSGFDYTDSYTYSNTMSEDEAVAFLVANGVVVFVLVCCIGFPLYLFFAYCLSKIAVKTGHEDKKFFAFIPIASSYLETVIAGRPTWYFLLYFVPLANVYVMITNWMEISKKLGKESWWGLVVLFFPYVAIPYLAFSKSDAVAPPVVAQ